MTKQLLSMLSLVTWKLQAMKSSGKSASYPYFNYFARSEVSIYQFLYANILTAKRRNFDQMRRVTLKILTQISLLMKVDVGRE